MKKCLGRKLLLKQVQAERSGAAAAEMCASRLQDYREAAADMRALRRITSICWSDSAVLFVPPHFLMVTAVTKQCYCENESCGP